MSSKPRYITLESPVTTVCEKIFFLMKAPILLPRWLISFLLARLVTNVILSPAVAKEQKELHPIYSSDDPGEQGSVIVNLLPKDPHKTFHDYWLRFSGLLGLSFLASKREPLYLKNPADKEHVDRWLSVDLLLSVWPMGKIILIG